MPEVANIPALARVPEGHYAQWVNACIAGHGKNNLSSSFDYAGMLTTILMGNWHCAANNKDSAGKFTGRRNYCGTLQI
jgi:hypothetical protein